MGKELAQKITGGKLSWGTRLSYASGDVACNVVFGMIGTLLTLFYTDYVGISPATVGLMMLLSRLFDGVSDLIMGVIVERTNSKWGKSRPWILWMSVPFALSAVLLFTVPHTTGMLQFLYLFVTYNFCTTVCYTAINLPYGSLSAMMTRVSSERDMLSVVRMGLSPIGKIIAATCTLPIVKLFGDDQAAWVKTMSIWAVLALILLLVCFFKCEETVRIEAKEKAAKVPLGKGFAALFKNQYFWAVLVLWMVQSVSFGISGTILPYYCKYIFGNDTWMYSALFLTETLTLVAGIFACTPLIRKFGKRELRGTCHRPSSSECSCIRYGRRRGGIRTVENTYQTGKSYFCRWFHWNKSRRRTCISSNDRTSLSGRVCKLLSGNRSTAGNSA